MFLRFAVSLIGAFVNVLSTWGLGTPGQEKQEPVARIVSPKEGARVERFDELEGKLHTKEGWPVILVKPLVDGEPWWVQPPVEEVQDGAFTVSAHFGNAETKPGTKFRVVIVLAKDKQTAHGFKAGMTLKSLPDNLPQSEYVTVVRGGGQQGEAPAKPRVLPFAGYAWEVKQGQRLGPGPNNWSDSKDNVWIDDQGHLHLAITQTEGRWHCAEVVASKSLGYGEYRWVIAGDLPALDPRSVLGLFLYENDRREIDFELSRWGDAKNTNAQFVVQPYTAKGNMHRFDTGQAKVLTCSLSFQPGTVQWRCWADEDITRKPLTAWKYTGRKVPGAEGLRTRMNLWLFGGQLPLGSKKQEIVIRSFHFEPVAPGGGVGRAR